MSGQDQGHTTSPSAPCWRTGTTLLRSIFAIAIFFLTFAATGCSSYSFYRLVPAPNLYTQTNTNPFTDLTPALRTTQATVVYVTDRQPEPCTDAQTAEGCQTAYGYRRSRSMAFGTTDVNLGKNITWDELVQASTHFDLSAHLKLSCSGTHELGRFPTTPDAYTLRNGEPVMPEEALAVRAAAESALRNEIQTRLAVAATPDVYLFIHGYNSEFEWPALVIAQVWHFMGRPGVPIAYSWPAARPGSLLGYQYDRESGEFTVYHLKALLKILGSVPNLRRVCIVAHSRGTDVLSSALRELTLELGGPAAATSALKLGVLVYAAADLDLEVLSQRFSADGLFMLGSRTIFYVHEKDSALGLSTWLFSSGTRVGRLRPENLNAFAKDFLNTYTRLEIVDAQIYTPSNFTHSYFYAHPAVLSDLIVALRDDRAAGAQNGRPLMHDPSGLWILPKGYPGYTVAPSP